MQVYIADSVWLVLRVILPISDSITYLAHGFLAQFSDLAAAALHLCMYSRQCKLIEAGILLVEGSDILV